MNVHKAILKIISPKTATALIINTFKKENIVEQFVIKGFTQIMALRPAFLVARIVYTVKMQTNV